MSTLTDAEASRALYAAGIPTVYHRKDSGLTTITPTWAEVAAAAKWASDEARDFAAAGRGVEIAFEGKPALDFTYLLARRLQLSAIPVGCLSLPLLCSTVSRRHEPESAERLNDWNNAAFLFLLDGFSAHAAPYERRDMFEMEWFLRSWLLDGKSLVMQGDGRLAKCEWWSNGLRSLFADRLSLVFEGPPKKLTLPVRSPQSAH